MSRLTIGCAAAGLVCAIAGRALGQGASAPNPSDVRGCADTLQARNLTRLTVFQRAVSADTTSAVRAQVDLVAQRIAGAARRALGAHGDAIPAADSLGKWMGSVLHLPFAVVFHRDQPGTWRSDTTSDTISAKVVQLYDGVLHALPPDSLWMIWPDGYAPDSVVFHLTLVGEKGDEARMAEHSLFAVFSARGILEQPALQKPDQYPPRYPADAKRVELPVTVLLQFVIGSDGRVDPGTLKVLRPTADTLRASSSAHYYQEFVDAAEAAIRNYRFYPARIGGCAVRQLVQFPFVFALLPRN